MKILVIEDDAIIREEVVDWLTFEGYDTISAADGQVGIQLAFEQLPDLIISDINMPLMNGHQVLAELRGNPTTALTPLIFLTALATRGDFRYGMELGAEDYITKPFTSEELINAVKAQLAKTATMRQRSNQQLNELRSTITRTIPHELRTPLIGILGYAEILGAEADTLSPNQIREMAEGILVSGRRLHRQIENYLLYAQLELRAADPVKATTYQSAAFEEPDWLIAHLAEKVARQYNRRTDLHLDMQAAAAICVTQPDLQTIITELVDNAFKFSPHQSPVTIASRLVGDSYQLQIIDHGRGIQPAEINRIGAYMQFERTLYEQQGSGLGLIIAKRLIELYGGTFTITSQPNRGTTLLITWRVRPPSSL